MNNFTASVINAIRQICRTQLNRLVTVALSACLLLTTGIANASMDTPRSEALGQAVRQRIEETDQSNRPKTTGQFLDEARGDVPLDERLGNITRDSVEAFKKLGEEYTPDVGQAARNLQDGLSGQDSIQ